MLAQWKFSLADSRYQKKVLVVFTCVNCVAWNSIPPNLLQLNEYQTDPYFLQYFQRNTTVCLIIQCFVRVVNLKLFCQFCQYYKSKQKQFHVRKSYKTRKSTLFCIGNSEENIDRIHLELAVHQLSYLSQLWFTSNLSMVQEDT